MVDNQKDVQNGWTGRRTSRMDGWAGRRMSRMVDRQRDVQNGWTGRRTSRIGGQAVKSPWARPFGGLTQKANKARASQQGAEPVYLLARHGECASPSFFYLFI